jgi:hypothetical protein
MIDRDVFAIWEKLKRVGEAVVEQNLQIDYIEVAAEEADVLTVQLPDGHTNATTDIWPAFHQILSDNFCLDIRQQ